MNNANAFFHQKINCSKSTMEALEKSVKYVKAINKQ